MLAVLCADPTCAACLYHTVRHCRPWNLPTTSRRECSQMRTRLSGPRCRRLHPYGAGQTAQAVPVVGTRIGPDRRSAGSLVTRFPLQEWVIDLNDQDLGRSRPQTRDARAAGRHFEVVFGKVLPKWYGAWVKCGIMEWNCMERQGDGGALSGYVADTAFWMSVRHLSAPRTSMPAASAGVLYAMPACGLM